MQGQRARAKALLRIFPYLLSTDMLSVAVRRPTRAMDARHNSFHGHVKTRRLSVALGARLLMRPYEQLGFSKTESSSTVGHFFDIIKTCLTEGTNVKISGLGSFIVRKKKARKGRNPQTGDEIEIAPRTVLSFRLSQVLREELNHRGEK